MVEEVRPRTLPLALIKSTMRKRTLHLLALPYGRV